MRGVSPSPSGDGAGCKATDGLLLRRFSPRRAPFGPIRNGFGAFFIYDDRGVPAPRSSRVRAFETTRRRLFFMQIIVRDNNVDQALRALKKKLQREGVYREMKLRRHYEKPSEKRAREKAAAVRRARKLERKRAERDGSK
jgi:small subunit ribosomal protein S21